VTGVGRAFHERLEDLGDGACTGELVRDGRRAETPAGSKDAADLGERSRLVGYPVEHGGHADDVEARVFEGGEVLGLPDFEARRAAVRARDGDAFLERIDTDDASFRSHALGDPARQAPRAAADVEDARPFLEREPIDEALTTFELAVAHPIVGLRELPAVMRERGRHRLDRARYG
jgi:hypothetical protein